MKVAFLEDNSWEAGAQALSLALAGESLSLIWVWLLLSFLLIPSPHSSMRLAIFELISDPDFLLMANLLTRPTLLFI